MNDRLFVAAMSKVLIHSVASTESVVVQHVE